MSGESFDELRARIERIRSGWEREHLDDPPDDADRHDEAPVDEPDWRAVAIELEKLANYWHERYLDLSVRGRLDYQDRTGARLTGAPRRRRSV